MGRLEWSHLTLVPDGDAAYVQDERCEARGVPKGAVMSDAAATRGVFDNSMAYVRWGGGPKTVLFVPGGPGNSLPEGPLRRVGGL